MLVNGKRALAYTTHIDWVKSIEGADNIELVGIGGWTCIAKIGEFKPNDLCVYFEIDSKLPADKEWSAFLESKKFKVKTMKLSKFQVISQGLALPYSAFDIKLPNEENVDLTDALGVIYAEAEDNARKGSGPDKYKKMSQRHPKIFKMRWARSMMKREWGKKIMFLLFGRQRDKKSSWPLWVTKTDEERIQNLSYLFDGRNTGKWIATEKIDGSSTTFTMRKKQFLVCSRNVVFDKPSKKCFYETNIYTEMAQKYDVENKMTQMMKDLKSEGINLEFLTIQGETFGASVQKRDYGLKDHDFMVFNVILGYKSDAPRRLNPVEMTELVTKYGFKAVPVVATDFVLPATCDEVLEYAASASSQVDGGMREGVVFRSLDGTQSFKAVSNSYLLKYHG